MPQYPTMRRRLVGDARVMISKMDQAAVRAKLMEERAKGEHPVILEELPRLVLLIEAVKRLIQEFREKL